MTELQELIDHIIEVAKEYPNINIYIQVSQSKDENLEIIHTINFCPACAVENAMDWAEEKNIQHINNKSHEKVN